jgi:hypothetical protein
MIASKSNSNEQNQEDSCTNPCIKSNSYKNLEPKKNLLKPSICSYLEENLSQSEDQNNESSLFIKSYNFFDDLCDCRHSTFADYSSLLKKSSEKNSNCQKVNCKSQFYNGLNLSEFYVFEIKKILVSFQNNLYIIENLTISKENSKLPLFKLKNKIISEILNKFQPVDLQIFESYFVGLNQNLPVYNFLFDVFWLKITSNELVGLQRDDEFLIKIPVRQIERKGSKVCSKTIFTKLQVRISSRDTAKSLLDRVGKEYPQLNLSCYSLEEADVRTESTGFWDVIRRIVPERNSHTIKSRNLKIASRFKNFTSKFEFEIFSCYMKESTFKTVDRVLTKNFPFRSRNKTLASTKNLLANLKSSVLYLVPKEPLLNPVSADIDPNKIVVALYDPKKESFIESSLSISQNHLVFKKKKWLFQRIIHKIPLAHIKNIKQTSYSFTITLK